MKTFLRVLYTKILYRIPLKFLLILLAVVVVFISSVKADDVSSLVTYIGGTRTTTIQGGAYELITTLDSDSYGTYCIEILDREGGNTLQYGFNTSVSFNHNLGIQMYIWWSRPFYACLNVDIPYIFLQNYSSPNTDITLTYKFFKLNALLNTSLPVFTSMECQEEYNLIPISSVDSNYCTTNNLCPVCEECQECPVFTGGASSLYINDILHIGSPLIYLNIPQEIGWDYEYTHGGTEMTIDVEGYNVDYDKIQDIITVQNYKPDSEDFSSLISNVVPLFVPGLCIILLLYFIFRFIKKIF